MNFILVTGAGGFVGRHVVQKLHAEGVPVIALLRHGAPDGFPPVGPRFLIAQGDLLAGPPKLPLPPGASLGGIVHLAAQVVLPGITGTDFMHRNIGLTANAIGLARQYQAASFLLLSSTSVYGLNPAPLLTEDERVLQPAAYGTSKYASELMVAELGSTIPVAAIRVPGIIGAGANPNFITRLVERAGRGEPLAVFNPERLFNSVVDVADIAATISLWLSRGAGTGFSTMNLACSEPVAVGALAQFLAARSGRGSGVESKSDPAATSGLIDIKRLQQQLGFTPRSVFEAVGQYADTAWGVRPIQP
ncbi:NAD-dependent epimerase/dehydratase family protein [Ferrovibrio sp.]|uniref:NAD-dependent epimerase/dehydratase family protein n=1 Tax=Ferrovibrio sp. TaxID=1917215 RepID=UPI003D29F401